MLNISNVKQKKERCMDKTEDEEDDKEIQTKKYMLIKKEDKVQKVEMLPLKKFILLMKLNRLGELMEAPFPGHQVFLRFD